MIDVERKLLIMIFGSDPRKGLVHSLENADMSNKKEMLNKIFLP